MSQRKVRIGIDVGGTFTHAVAVDNHSSEVLSHCVTPTSHSSELGVAAGILESFRMIQEDLDDAEVVFLAHSTTQATNALLEGDVAKVGIVGLGKGLEGAKAKSDLKVGDLELSEGKFLHSQLEFREADPTQIQDAVKALKAQNCGAIVAAQGFSVDDPSGEKQVMDLAREGGLPACGTHEMSGLYGLRVRARTAVLNASILPKMIETAEMTHQALTQREVEAPLMVMRSDGGVMSLEEVRRRPVMTLLSGPAAGVAAALMFLKASDALFLEVGGTSTDICLVKDGKAAVKSASVGGHPTYLKTLDSRTLGIAGGSMIGRSEKGELSVGPRSAHVAGFGYCTFAEPEFLQGELKVLEVQPLKDDPIYYVIENEAGQRTSPTTTCAGNFLGFIKPEDYSGGNTEGVKRAFEALAKHLGADSPEAVARQVLDTAAEKVLPTISALVKEYGVGDRTVKLLGGGGGAGAIVPIVAEKLGFPFEIAERAEVISAIGAALAMVKETIERNLVDPSQEDLRKIRNEAESAVIGMGADPETVEVTVSVDAQKSLVSATATGSIAFSEGETGEVVEVSPEERLETLKGTSKTDQGFDTLGDTEHFYLYQSQREEKYFFGFLKRKKTTLWVTDRKGNVKLQVPGGITENSTGSHFESALSATLDKHTEYGDAGALIPALHVVAGRKMTDLTSLTSAEQVLTLARQELSNLDPETPVYFLVHPARG